MSNPEINYVRLTIAESEIQQMTAQKILGFGNTIAGAWFSAYIEFKLTHLTCFVTVHKKTSHSAIGM
ncbi:hypothetical protein QUA26_06985 [Microcoleus sp. Pol12A4]|uniref:hypothetical protein n=1 Tax=Microcoleus sp. Pol8_D6 TaxID=2818899 RepID=UPI002FD1A12E